MGLNANSTRLGTISDNIANSETFGYKRSQVAFSSLVLEQRSSAYSAGGVFVDTFKDVSAVGSLISTGNATDIAVAGRGLIPVTDVQGVDQTAADRNLKLLPTGSFTADQNGNLRTQSGMRDDAVFDDQLNRIFDLGGERDNRIRLQLQQLGHAQLLLSNRDNHIDRQAINGALELVLRRDTAAFRFANDAFYSFWF